MITINDLRVGMKVKLRDDFQDGKLYGEWYFLEGMKKGEVVTVSFVGRTYFDIEEEKDKVVYTPEMVEYIVPEMEIYFAKEDIKAGEKIKIVGNMVIKIKKVWKEIDYNTLFGDLEPKTIKVDGETFYFCYGDSIICDCVGCSLHKEICTNRIKIEDLLRADKIEIEVEQ